MEHWLQLIQDVGFPIFVSFYLLHRLEVKFVKKQIRKQRKSPTNQRLRGFI